MTAEVQRWVDERFIVKTRAGRYKVVCLCCSGDVRVIRGHTPLEEFMVVKHDLDCDTGFLVEVMKATCPA